MELSTLVLRLKKTYTDALKAGEDPTIKYILKNFSLTYDPAKEEKITKVLKRCSWNIYDHIKDYIQNKKKDVARDTIKDYNSLIKHLKALRHITANRLTSTALIIFFMMNL